MNNADIFTKDNTIKSVLWKFFERVSVQVITLITSVVMARLISPEEYGVLAILFVFVNFAIILVQSGMGAALIQKVDSSELDYSSVFVLTTVISITIYICLFVTAPIISNYYENDELTIYLRTISLVLFPNTFYSIQVARVSAKMQFKVLFYCSAIASGVSGAFGIIAAILGLGVWALIIQQLALATVNAVLIPLRTKWVPKLQFSKERAKVLFSFGWKIMFCSVLDTICGDIRNLIMGKKYTSADLGYYTQAKQYPQSLNSSINSAIGSVLFPVMSTYQDKPDMLIIILRRAIKISTFIVWPVMLGLSVVSDSLIRVILTDKWESAIPYLQVICIAFVFEPIVTIHSQARNSIGQAGLHLKIVTITKLIDLGSIIIATIVSNDAYWIAVTFTITSFVSAVLGALSNSILLGYTITMQLKDVLPNMLISIAMSACVLLISYIPFLVGNKYCLLTIQVLAGCLIYVSLSIVTRNDSYVYLRQIIFEKIKKYKGNKNV